MSERKIGIRGLMVSDVTQYEALRRLLPQTIRALANGETVSFGPYTITPDGIRYLDRVLAWEDVGMATMRKGDVCIEQRSDTHPWHCSPVSQVPNAFVFMALVNPLFARQDRRG